MIHFVLLAVAILVLGQAVVVRAARARNRRLRQSVHELALVADMSELLQLSTGFAEAASILPSFAPRLFPSCDGALYLDGMTPDSLAMAAAWGEEFDTLAFAPPDCLALRHARPHVATGGGTACRHRDSGELTLCVPLIASGDVLGVLVLRGERAADERTASLAGRVAAQLACVLANLRVRETLRMHAVRDELTGLFNRRYLQDALRRELQRAGAMTGVIVADVDNFKRYNDTWGHPGGDALLQQLARLMQRVLREDDVVCRYGGEEFVIIVPGATFDLLHSSAERLREECARMPIRHDGHVLGNITISAGIAISSRHGATVAELIAAADRALYVAKTGGRDRVSAPPPQAVGRDAA